MLVTFHDIYRELEQMGTAQNVKVYKRHGAQEPLFGVSFANFKALKKKVVSEDGKKGCNQSIARELWSTGNADAKIFAAMIAEPEKMSKELLDQWVTQIDFYPIADGFAKLVHQTPYGDEKMQQWVQSDEEYIKRVGFTILCNVSKEKSPRDDAFFLPFVELAESMLQGAPNRAKESMNSSLIAIGAVNEKLRDRVLEATKRIGPVEIDHGETSCKTFIIEEYLNKIYERRQTSKG